jgi:hypothetical protein
LSAAVIGEHSETSIREGGAMGFLDTIKGWFNIGGVKVKLEGVDPVVSKEGNEIGGKVNLTSKGDKHVLKVNYKFVMERTTGRGENKETKETILGQSSMTDPFDIKAGETKSLDFTINYDIQKELKDMGGAMGAIGKLGAFASGEKTEYYVVAVCDVKGTAFDPSDKLKVKVES